MKYYKVHYSQVNQQYVYVKAKNSKDAIKKANKVIADSSLQSYNDEEPIEIFKKEFIN